jgi:hypothetical protein
MTDPAAFHEFATFGRTKLARHPDLLYALSPANRRSPLTRRHDDWPPPDDRRTGVAFNAETRFGARP